VVRIIRFVVVCANERSARACAPAHASTESKSWLRALRDTSLQYFVMYTNRRSGNGYDQTSKMVPMAGLADLADLSGLDALVVIVVVRNLQ